MGATGGVSAASAGISALNSIGSAYANAQQQKANAIYQQGIYNVNAAFAKFQAEDSVERGKLAADEIERIGNKAILSLRKSTKQFQAKQRIALASQGIETTSGSALDIISETRFLSDLDSIELEKEKNLRMITAKNNAWREAWGFKIQSENFSSQSRFIGEAADNSARATLLAGGSQSLSYGLQADTYGLKAYSDYSENKPKKEKKGKKK